MMDNKKFKDYLKQDSSSLNNTVVNKNATIQGSIERMVIYSNFQGKQYPDFRVYV